MVEQSHYDIIIIGAGPTCLGAAIRLNQLKNATWALFEAESSAGGLAATDIAPEGFLVDYGGHVVFSHYKYFDECLDEALPRSEDWCHQRISYIRYKDCWVPYPFQNNLSALPVQDQVKCLDGLIDAAVEARSGVKPTNFEEWMLRNLGEGICDTFMRPYTQKVWATSPKEMQCSWLGERVPAPDAKKAMNNVLFGKVEGNWGPNATFRFPAEKGTGHIWNSVAKTLPASNLHFNHTVSSINEDTKTVVFSDGKAVSYGSLITTMPLDTLIAKLKRPEDYSAVKNLFYSSTNVVSIGVRGQRPDHVGATCWYYFPESNCPFYRATVFSNYAPANVPTADKRLRTLRLADGSLPKSTDAIEGPYWSLLLEVSASEYKPVDQSSLVDDCIQGLVNTGLLVRSDEIVSIYHKFCEHGYPTPSLKRNAVLDAVLPALQRKSIYSRGRFGSWKYEVSNQDHSFMLGVEAADRITMGGIELSLHYPDVVNGRKNEERSLQSKIN